MKTMIDSIMDRLTATLGKQNMLDDFVVYELEVTLDEIKFYVEMAERQLKARRFESFENTVRLLLRATESLGGQRKGGI